MNKNTESKNPNTQTDETIDAIDTIESVELDNVTGGCAACGCGNPGVGTMAPQLFSQAFNRR